jgi:ABC-type transport system involved in multi-copper enzyme maturation permease subunit
MTRRFEIYRNSNRENIAIPLGFSWMAAAFDWIWALYLRLWPEAIVLGILSAISTGVLYANHASWKSFVFSQVIQGLIIGFAARRLREMSAERRGYSYLCTIPAKDGATAIAKLLQVGGEPLSEWKGRHLTGVPDFAPKPLRPLFAIALLTIKAAFRYRLVLTLLGLLIAVVFVLPGIIKHDGSAQGFTQILITYTLSVITAILGFTTLWLACGTLARDIEEMQLFLVTAKPVPRWQIWLGKWIGIMVINLGMLAVAGSVVFGLLQFRTSELSPAQQAKLLNEVLVARAGIREPAVNVQGDVEKVMAERLKDATVAAMDRDFVRKQIEEAIKARQQVVPPGMLRRWTVDLGSDARERLAGRPLFIRVKFFTTQYNSEGTVYPAFWEIGPPEGRRLRLENSLPAESFVEFGLDPKLTSDLIEPSGRLAVDFQNWTEQPLLFPLDDGLEVLFHEGGFGLNYARGLMIIAFWLGLMTAIGLTCSSFLSFPVAAFCSIGILILGMSGGTLKQVVEQGGIVDIDHDTGAVTEATFINRLSVAVYGNAKKMLDQVSGYSPISNLSTGRSITWLELAKAFFVINILVGGLISLVGIAILTRRELAAPTKF